MDINNPFYLDVLKTLVKSKVEFILMGGLAVSFHGYSRYTGHMDLWLTPDKSNLNKLYEALLGLGYPEDIVNNMRHKREIDNPTPIKLN